MIIDNFLCSFDDLKEHSLRSVFKDEVNPVDKVVYPLICKDIPKNVEIEIYQRLAIYIGDTVKNPVMFMRKSPEGVDCPHQVHSDASMGKFSLMLYLNNHDGGTSLVRHKETGISYNPENQEYVDIVVNDQNNHEAWEITDMVDMKENRAFIFDSRRLHRSEPIGGFGKEHDSRVVLTCFFS